MTKVRKTIFRRPGRVKTCTQGEYMGMDVRSDGAAVLCRQLAQTSDRINAQTYREYDSTHNGTHTPPRGSMRRLTVRTIVRIMAPIVYHDEGA